MSQLHDWPRRGDDPIVRDMNLYVYSMWVYRVEKNLTAKKQSDRATAVRHVEIEFDESYPSRSTFTQRLTVEQRVPMLEGMQFVPETNAEVHHMLQAVLFRPVFLPPPEEHEARDLRLLSAYQKLCTAPDGQGPWPAQNMGPDRPGPWQRGWELFLAEQKVAAGEAQRKERRSASVCCLWRTAEVRQRLAGIVAAEEGDAAEPPSEESYLLAPSVLEYAAFVTVQASANFARIAQARTEPRQKREADDAVAVPEASVSHGGEDDGEADGHVEAAALRAQAGLASLGADTRIVHHFDSDTLRKVLAFATAERVQSFVKDLMKTPVMESGVLPPPQSRQGGAGQRAARVREDVQKRYEGLSDLSAEALKELVQAQRKLWMSKSSEAQTDADCPAAPVAGESGGPSDPQDQANESAPRRRPEPKAFFAPSDAWRRPSDYVAHLAKKFEEGPVDPATGGRAPRTLKRDQALFVATFANACNAAWDDEQEEIPWDRRRTFQMLLMGQGGSGKTAIVQEIVLPAVDFLFGVSATLIACAKWSQAENISTETHAATTCHRAAQMGIGEHRNRDMVPDADMRTRLENIWCDLKLFVIEEVSMVSPNLYNMLLYRAFQARRAQCNLQEANYQKPCCAFGRVPIVIYLGDFLQLKPTGSGRSLLSDLRQMAAADSRKEGPPVEHQQVMNSFCNTKLCFELQATNRFKDPRLADLMNFMRKPKKGKVPAGVAETWARIQLRTDDPRLAEERFQTGHMLAWYWDTVARWMMMRASRDARTLGQVLYLVQAADASSPQLPRDLAAKLLNQVNPGLTGGMHGMLPLHLGMRIRLLEHLDLKRKLVKDAEGEVVHVAINPRDQDEVDRAKAENRPAYLRFLPFGVWVRMDKYRAAPFRDRLAEHAEGVGLSDAAQLVFIEPQTSSPFDFRKHKVTRTGLQISHAMVLTSTACQGRTMHEGVIIDAGYKDADDMDGFWLHLYVMLSRATTSDNLLMIRDPGLDFLSRGPPADLAARLREFGARTERCRKAAVKLAQDLGLAKFLHE